ncbi:hypothetical protein [Cryobacterium sp. Hz9]|uniref:hypothetical protein n=1 Tax=Cryobacterium sp. Hz9 TaxID=1259167 RepID=UPI00106BFF0E|nr:hypothetical protein [Cryobacterium sp. Hz9]TFB71503.1 hypothetical protein E3N85_00595 [Cryobacterium sp. Hz9]
MIGSTGPLSGRFTRTIPQGKFDDLLSRTALAALYNYPKVAIEDDDHNLQNDIACCLEPVAAIANADAVRLRVAVERVITNPTAHRSELLALVIELAPPPTA